MPLLMPMDRNHLVILTSHIDAGRTTITERVLKIIEQQRKENPPEIVFLDPNSEEDRARIAQLMRNDPSCVVIGEPEMKFPEAGIINRMFPQAEMKSVLEMAAKKLEPIKPKKQSFHERANPNQPFYAQFQKRPKKNRHR